MINKSLYHLGGYIIFSFRGWHLHMESMSFCKDFSWGFFWVFVSFISFCKNFLMLYRSWIENHLVTSVLDIKTYLCASLQVLTFLVKHVKIFEEILLFMYVTCGLSGSQNVLKWIVSSFRQQTNQLDTDGNYWFELFPPCYCIVIVLIYKYWKYTKENWILVI